jgi:guanylate kinase
VTHPQIIVFSAPSAAGKTTIANEIVKELPVRFATSATTREPRPGEQHGDDYYFYDVETFSELVDDNAFIEYEEVHDNTYYGTLKDELERGDEAVLLDIDVKGALTINDLYGDNALLIFIEPPSLDVIEERLRQRDAHSDAEIQRRLDRATMEMQHRSAYDEVIVNDVLSDAVNEAQTAIATWLDK